MKTTTQLEEDARTTLTPQMVIILVHGEKCIPERK
jgi:hypothetical protein